MFRKVTKKMNSKSKLENWVQWKNSLEHFHIKVSWFKCLQGNPCHTNVLYVVEWKVRWVVTKPGSLAFVKKVSLACITLLYIN